MASLSLWQVYGKFTAYFDFKEKDLEKCDYFTIILLVKFKNNILEQA